MAVFFIFNYCRVGFKSLNIFLCIDLLAEIKTLPALFAFSLRQVEAIPPEALIIGING
tara:strand:+ start:421 stop:594 length:174 start_codon:yes stop_codon:yes gene_type:complete